MILWNACNFTKLYMLSKFSLLESKWWILLKKKVVILQTAAPACDRAIQVEHGRVGEADHDLVGGPQEHQPGAGHARVPQNRSRPRNVRCQRECPHKYAMFSQMEYTSFSTLKSETRKALSCTSEWMHSASTSTRNTTDCRLRWVRKLKKKQVPVFVHFFDFIIIAERKSRHSILHVKMILILWQVGFPWSEIRNISFNDRKFVIKPIDKKANVRFSFKKLTLWESRNEQWVWKRKRHLDYILYIYHSICDIWN